MAKSLMDSDSKALLTHLASPSSEQTTRDTSLMKTLQGRALTGGDLAGLRILDQEMFDKYMRPPSQIWQWPEEEQSAQRPGPEVTSRISHKEDPDVPPPKDLFPVAVQVTAELEKHGLGGGRVAKLVTDAVACERSARNMTATDLLEVSCTFKDIGAVVNVTTDAYCSKAIVQVEFRENIPEGSVLPFKRFTHEQFEAYQVTVPESASR